MPKCPKCQKEVYFAEKVTSLGKDWHGPCLRCEKCNKTLSSGSHAELFWSLVRRNGGVTTDEAPDEAEENGDENAGHGGKPYCHNPCYSAMFGPGGFGRGGAESHKY